jgi:hypothetical protein
MGRRRDIVIRIAPAAPPCYETRMQWLEYLASAAESQRTTRLFADPGARVLVMEEGAAPRINPEFQFCRDCSAQHSDRMLRAGKCQPDHLRELLAHTEPEVVG